MILKIMSLTARKKEILKNYVTNSVKEINNIHNNYRLLHQQFEKV